MARTALVSALCILTAAGSAGAVSPGEIRDATAGVDSDAIIANAEETKDWLNYGLDYAETRYSRLDSVTARMSASWGWPGLTA